MSSPRKSKRKGSVKNEYVLKEMKLVPPDQVKPEYRMKKRAYRSPFQPYKNAMADMDVRMKEILQNKDKSFEEKWPEYERALNKFLLFKDKTAASARRTLPPSLPPPPPPPPPPKDSQKEKQIRYLGVKKGRTGNRLERAAIIMDRLKEANVTWDEKHRIVYPDSGVDKSSNITDLLSDAATFRDKPSRPPKGYKKFYETLKKLNIPEHVVGNVHRLDLINPEPTDVATAHLSRARSHAPSPRVPFRPRPPSPRPRMRSWVETSSPFGRPAQGKSILSKYLHERGAAADDDDDDDDDDEDDDEDE